ncbi:MAG: hypothetical protein ACYTKD_28700 [Planctomycetota bacterium]|jgi:hypothetical protein
MTALWRFIAFHGPQLFCVAWIAVLFLVFDDRAYAKASDRTGLPVRFWRGLVVTAVLFIGVSVVGMGSMKLLVERVERKNALEIKDLEISLLKKEIAHYKTRKP